MASFIRSFHPGHIKTFLCRCREYRVRLACSAFAGFLNSAAVLACIPTKSQPLFPGGMICDTWTIADISRQARRRPRVSPGLGSAGQRRTPFVSFMVSSSIHYVQFLLLFSSLIFFCFRVLPTPLFLLILFSLSTISPV